MVGQVLEKADELGALGAEESGVTIRQLGELTIFKELINQLP